MKRSIVIAASVLLACMAVSAAPPPQAVFGNLVFLESADAKGQLSMKKVASSMAELARTMNLPVSELPRVLVLYVSPQTGKALGIQSCALRRNSGQIAEPYYELWIVGDAHPADYTIAFEKVLERHFALAMTDAERQKVVTRVVRYLDATIDVRGE